MKEYFYSTLGILMDGKLSAYERYWTDRKRHVLVFINVILMLELLFKFAIFQGNNFDVCYKIKVACYKIFIYEKINMPINTISGVY